MEKRRFKPFLPSFNMGNVRCLGNKTEELTGLVRSQTEYQECSIMLYREMVTQGHIRAKRQTVRADWECAENGKRKSEGVAVLVDNRWCNPGHIIVEEQMCSLDTELLAGSPASLSAQRDLTCYH